MEHLNNESADARISEWRRPAWAADRARQYILRRLVGHGSDGRTTRPQELAQLPG